MFKPLKLIVVVCFLLLHLTAVSFAEEYVDRIVAVVNEDVITLTELEKTGREYFERIRMQAPPGELERALKKARKEVLSTMINTIIARQKAEEFGITVEETEIDNAVEQIISRNNVTLEDFRKELASMNMSEQEFRDNIRDQILQSKLVNFQVRSRIVIIEEDIREYYEKEYTQEKEESGYYIMQMGFNWTNPDSRTGDPGTKEDIRKKAEEIRERAVAGENFKELARTYSDLPSAVDGGDLGLIKKDEMAEYMRDAILPLHPGDISQVIETGSTFQFFKLLSVRDGDIILKAPYESVKDDIRDILFRREMENQYKAWVEGLRKQAYVKILL
ncbi:MAG: SurA N-terminal domain-containing protein [Deltaproteobacteria bacterium]|jgi:peptidyl-prolyl cis-trans isomerase SurA|nr:SurA N-terminal domain-containing protein [Deltaproteobacteria bacterium]